MGRIPEEIRPQQGQTTTPGTPFPTPFKLCVGSFMPLFKGWVAQSTG